MPRHSIIQIILRVGIALVFLYPAVAAWFEPIEWIGYLPDFVRALPLDELVILHIIGAGEVLLALWFLSGRALFIPSVLASVFVLLIMLTNLSQMSVLFRDIGVLTATLALAVRSYDGPSLIRWLRV